MSKIQPIDRISTKELVQVIVASCLGSVFEWYDFELYGLLASDIARHFFSALSSGSAFVMALFTFASGLALRPLGALLFGYFGDKIGRKYSFFVTISLMGLSTFLVGLLPSYETIGIAAPILLIFLRCIQGISAGGEYGGAAIYICEHAPEKRRGLYSGIIQASAIGGDLSGLLVVITCRLIFGQATFEVSLFLRAQTVRIYSLKKNVNKLLNRTNNTLHFRPGHGASHFFCR